MIDETNLERGDTGIVLRIPMKLKKRGGRKEVIVPDSDCSTCAESLARILCSS